MMTNEAKSDYFLHQIQLGMRYALWVLLISAAMGAFFGAFGGIVWQPMLFIPLLLGTLVCLNSVFALLCTLPWLIFRLRGKEVRYWPRYIGLSTGFLLVFAAFFLLFAPFGERFF
ncbi:MAG: hypothetical protein AAGM67_20890 [Bacteroidota bacterium]